MTDQRYNYENMVGVKIVAKKDNKIFLVTEPKTNEWMPGRLSLPGGKLFLGESIIDGLKRKILTEIGLDVEIEGLVKMINILMPSKNVYHLVFIANYKSGDIDLSRIEAENAAWYSKDQILKFKKDDYAEYYNDEVLKEIFSEKYTLIPMSAVLIQRNEQESIMNWMKQGMPNARF